MAEKPIHFDALADRVQEREARAPAPDVPLTTTIFLSGDRPQPEVRAVEEVRSLVETGANRTFRVEIDLGRVAIGRHSFAPGVEGTELPAARELLREEDYHDALVGHAPDHLPLRIRPERLDERLAAPVKIDALVKADPETRWATTVFAPDERVTFSDTAFPWSTVGRVETSLGGWASGVLVGPRHLVTCSHAIQWFDPPNPSVAGWVKFTPSYFDGSEPFGTAWSTNIYWQEQVEGPTIDGTEGRNDYVVVVLDRRIGDLTGWMGTRTYSDDWDGNAFWTHVGYPGDLNAGTRPSYQGSIALNGADDEPETNQQIFHTGDVWPGQSGGPYFAWWDGEGFPRVVADQSWQNVSNNGASGGSALVDMVIRAHNDFP